MFTDYLTVLTQTRGLSFLVAFISRFLLPLVLGYLLRVGKLQPERSQWQLHRSTAGLKSVGVGLEAGP